MKYGIYDVVDHVWIGDKSGPKLFEAADHDLACISAMVLARQVGLPLTRYRARMYEAQEVKLKDEVPLKKDALTALTELEEGK